MMNKEFFESMRVVVFCHNFPLEEIFREKAEGKRSERLFEESPGKDNGNGNGNGIEK